MNMGKKCISSSYNNVEVYDLIMTEEEYVKTIWVTPSLEASRIS